jgi:enoyl-CoA hydratase/carnithine racemase
VAVVDLDPRVVAAGPTAVEAALADVAGEPVLVRFPAAGLAAADERGLRTWLRTAPAATMGVGDAPRAFRDALDLWVTDPDTADRLGRGFSRAPLAGVTVALLVRNGANGVWPGLVAESTAYSMLQGSPEFAAWRAARRPTSSDDRTPRVQVEVEGGHTVVTFTRPGRHNAIDARFRDELDDVLAAAAAGRGAVIVRGAGASFCSGGDLDEFGSLPDPATAHVVRLSRSLAWRFHELGRRLVVGLHGACLGAGIELPAFAAHVVAADDARIGLPELGMGLLPGAGGTVSIPRRAGRHALLELVWDGEPIDAYRARRWGLVDEVVPPSRLDDRLVEIAATISASTD